MIVLLKPKVRKILVNITFFQIVEYFLNVKIHLEKSIEMYYRTINRFKNILCFFYP